MRVFCPEGHEQINVSGGGPCEICMRESPDKIICKDPACPSIKDIGEKHFHLPDRSYYRDIDGKPISSA